MKTLDSAVATIAAAAVHAVADHPISAPGSYMSLPLEGRVDLMRPVVERKPEAEEQSGPSPSAAASPPIYAQNLPAVVTVAPPPPPEPARPTSSTWNAQHEAPPHQSGPEYGEMRGGMTAFYENAWDRPLGHQKAQEDWNANLNYPTIPDVVKEDKWYDGAATKTVPDYSKVETVFPWESQVRNVPDRHFPASDLPPPRPVPIPSTPTLSLQAPTPPLETPQPAPPPRADTPPEQPKRVMSFQEAMAGYTNAWDDVPSIKNYANKLAGVRDSDSAQRRSSASGMKTPALRKGDGQQSYFADSMPSQDVKQKAKADVRPKKRRNGSSEVVETRSEGSHDGDDEETTSGEDEDNLRSPILKRSSGSPIGQNSGRGPSSSKSGNKSRVGSGGAPVEPKRTYQARSIQTEPTMTQDRVVQTPPASESKRFDFPNSSGPARPDLTRSAGGSSSLVRSVGSPKVAGFTSIGGVASQTSPVASPPRPRYARMSSEETVTSATQHSPASTRSDLITPTLEDERPRVDGKSSPLSPTLSNASSSGSTVKPVGRRFDPSTSIDVSILRYCSLLLAYRLVLVTHSLEKEIPSRS